MTTDITFTPDTDEPDEGFLYFGHIKGGDRDGAQAALFDVRRVSLLLAITDDGLTVIKAAMPREDFVRALREIADGFENGKGAMMREAEIEAERILREAAGEGGDAS